MQFVAAPLVLAPSPWRSSRCRCTGAASLSSRLHGWWCAVARRDLPSAYLIRQGAATRVASLFYLVARPTTALRLALFGETYTLAAAAGMGSVCLRAWLVTKQ